MKTIFPDSGVAAFVFFFALIASPASGAEAVGGSAPRAYTPGLGDIMGGIQLRHAKLWFAGKARNWALAAYELDELKEGFEDAAAWHPEHNGQPIAARIGPVTAGPMERLGNAVKDRDSKRFTRAYDELSRSCTSCHQATGYGFIRIGRPTLPPLTNQRFDLESPP